MAQEALAFTATHDEAKAKALAAVKETFGNATVDSIIAIIENGITAVPEILAELNAAGVALPSWIGLVVNVVLAILKPYLPA